VRRIRRTATKPTETTEEKKSLEGFLSSKGSSAPRKLGGSASVAGDQIAVSKESSLTGEVYVRADGKKGKMLLFVECGMSLSLRGCSLKLFVF
jgi:hypothetical protein